MASENVQPPISRPQLQNVTSCLDGFTLELGKSHVKIIGRFLGYNDLASRLFRKDDQSLVEHIVRFKKNLCFFFRTLDFFQDFFLCRGLPQPGGFWGLIQQQSGGLIEKPTHAQMLLEFLISSRDAFVRKNPGDSPGLGFARYIQRLIFHWSSMMTQAKTKGVPRPTLSQQDTERLAERCAEWRTLLENGRLADAPELDNFLGRHKTLAQASRPDPPKPSVSLDAITDEPRAIVKTGHVAAELSDEVKGSIVSIGRITKRKRITSDLDSSQAVEQDTPRSNKRSRGVSPEPKNRQKTKRSETATPSPKKSPKKSPGSDKKLAKLDKRLSDSLEQQQQHGTEITSLNSQIQSLTAQLSDITAVTTRLSDTLAEDESVVEIDTQLLKTAVAEALHSELPRQLDSQLGALVQAVVSRIPIKDLVEAAVARIPIQNLIQSAMRDTSAQSARNDDKRARDGVIGHQRDTIRQLEEKVQRLEKELSRSGQSSPYHSSDRRGASSTHRGPLLDRRGQTPGHRARSPARHGPPSSRRASPPRRRSREGRS